MRQLWQETLEFARLWIRIPIGGIANLVKSININNYSCQIIFEEDICFPYPQTRCGKCMNWGLMSEGILRHAF